MRLRDAACQQHPRARPVQVAQQLDQAIRTRLATVRLDPVPLMTWHNDIVQRCETSGGLGDVAIADHPAAAPPPRPQRDPERFLTVR